MQEFRIRKGSVGEVLWVKWTQAASGFVAAADVASVTCVITTMDSDAVTSNGTQVSVVSVPAGYSFGWLFGSLELATARRLFADFTATNTGWGATKLERLMLIVED